MQKDQRGRPFAPPNVNDKIVESEDASTYMMSFSHNGRRVEWLSRALQPIARFGFAWLAWRQKRRNRRGVHTA
jgi:hypothetical protein